MKRKYLILFSLSGLIICLDQFAKALAWRFLPPGYSMDLIPGLLSLSFAENTGFAFGVLQRGPASLQDISFVAVPLFAMVLIVMIFIKLRDDQMLTSVALTSILAGAMGNLIDRIQYTFVVDFLDWHVGNWAHLPPLNFADIAILVGVVLMFVATLKQKHPEETNG